MDEANRLAERVQRSAVRKMAVFTVVFLVWQISYFTIARPTGEVVRNVDIVRTAGFLLWSAVLLVLFATGGGALAPRRVRAILDDELARAQRATSYQHGFWVMICLSFVGYIASMIFTVRPADLVHVILSGGVVAVLVSQLVLERRSAG